MSIPLTALLLIGVAAFGASIALAAFTWAVRSGHLDETNAGAYVIFDEEEPVGTPTDEVFRPKGERRGR